MGPKYIVPLTPSPIRFPCHHAEFSRAILTFSLTWDIIPTIKIYIFVSGSPESETVDFRWDIEIYIFSMILGNEEVLSEPPSEKPVSNIHLSCYLLFTVLVVFLPRPKLQHIYVVLSRNICKWSRNNNVFKNKVFYYSKNDSSLPLLQL